MENIIESTVNAEQVETVTPQQTEQVDNNVEVVNGEVAAPQQIEKPVQSPEENSKYAAIRREAEQKAAAKARDEMISEMYGQSHGIHTYSDYQVAIKKAQEESEIQKNIDKGIDPEIARELAEAKKFREQYESEKLTRSQQEAKQRDYEAFIDAYPGVKAEEIPSIVWGEVEKGKSLVDAYAKHENTVLRQKLAEYEKGNKTLESNVKNASSTPGSLAGNGKGDDGFVSYDVFEANKDNQSWVMKNYNKIIESRSKW